MKNQNNKPHERTIMLGPVSIEKDDLICIDVAAGIVWIEKKKDSRQESPSQVPDTPTPRKSGGRRRFQVTPLFVGKCKRGADSHTTALCLARTLAWVVGLHVGDDTDLYLNTGNTYVFRVT